MVRAWKTSLAQYSHYKPGFRCPLVAQSDNYFGYTTFFPTQGKIDMPGSGLGGQTTEATVVASQTSGTGCGVSNLVYHSCVVLNKSQCL